MIRKTAAALSLAAVVGLCPSAWAAEGVPFKELQDEVDELVMQGTDRQNQIDQEIAARMQADTNLQNQIDQEIAARAQADTNLQNQIDQEVLDRTLGDNDLQNQIDALENVVDDLSVVVTRILPGSCPGIGSFKEVFKKVANLGSFTKLASSSVVEVSYMGHISANLGGNEAATFELRVDNVSNRGARYVLSPREGGDEEWGVITGVYFGLPAGEISVSVWVRGSGDDEFGQATLDSGCFNSHQVIVKEYR